MKKILTLLFALISFAAFPQYYNASEYRVVHKNDSAIISGIGQMRYDANDGKLRFGNGTIWDSYLGYSGFIVDAAGNDFAFTDANGTLLGLTNGEAILGNSYFQFNSAGTSGMSIVGSLILNSTPSVLHFNASGMISYAETGNNNGYFLRVNGSGVPEFQQYTPPVTAAGAGLQISGTTIRWGGISAAPLSLSDDVYFGLNNHTIIFQNSSGNNAIVFNDANPGEDVISLSASGTAVASVVLNSSDGSLNITGETTVNGNFSASNVVSGTYTPTLTNVANIDGSTAFQCQYMRIGNVVTVSGKASVDPTLTATSTQIGISLPVVSNIAADEDCAGTAFASGIAGQGAAILGDATNDRAQMQFISTDVTNQPMFFTFTYEVL